MDRPGDKIIACYIRSMENKLESISDDELLRSLSELLQQSRCIESELVAHIAEVDEDFRTFFRCEVSQRLAASSETMLT